MALSIDEQVERFVTDCQDRGFDPATAFVLYQELNAVAAPTVFNEALASDTDRQGQAVLARLREAVLAVKSPQDWTTYCQKWPAIACGSDAPMVDMATKKAFVRSVGDVWNQWVPHEDSHDLTNRLTVFALHQGAERYRQASEGMTWDRLRQVVQADRMTWTWSSTVESTALTDDQAMAQLQESLHASSVRSVRWNWIDGDGAAQLTTLAQGLDRAQHELHRRTAWDGPVLGLNGQVRLSFGNAHDATGYACPTDDGSTMIMTSPEVGWGVVSHEWFHAFDQVCAHHHGALLGEMLSDQWAPNQPITVTGTPEQIQTAQAFSVLLDQLMVQAPGVAIREQGLRESRDSWAERITTALPWAADLVAQEQQRLTDGTWARASSLDVWAAGYRAQGRDELEARTLAETMVSEIEFLRTADAQHGNGASVWREYLNRFDANLRRHHRHGEEPSGYEGYFQIPTEVLAHSFESTFGDRSTSITDVHAGHAPLRYPTAAEGLWQAQAWSAFFQATAPGWRQLAHLPEPAVATEPVAARPRSTPPSRLPNLHQLGARLLDSCNDSLVPVGADNDAQAVLAARQPRSSRRMP